MIHLDFKKGILIGSLITGSFSFVFTQMYINNNCPYDKNMLHVYLEMIKNGRLK
jgi:hypothetical protein